MNGFDWLKIFVGILLVSAAIILSVVLAILFEGLGGRV